MECERARPVLSESFHDDLGLRCTGECLERRFEKKVGRHISLVDMYVDIRDLNLSL